MSWSSDNPQTTLFDGLYFRVNWSGKVDSVEVNSGLETSKVRLMYRVQGSPIQIKIQPFRKPVKKSTQQITCRNVRLNGFEIILKIRW